MFYSPRHKIGTSAFAYQLFQSLIRWTARCRTHGKTCNQHLRQVFRPPPYASYFPLPTNFPLLHPQIWCNIINWLFLQLFPWTNCTQRRISERSGLWIIGGWNWSDPHFPLFPRHSYHPFSIPPPLCFSLWASIYQYTCSIPRWAVRSHSLVCIKNSLLIVGIVPIRDKDL